MVAWALSRAVQLLLGTLYPAYASYKAVRNKDVREYVRWMMYWIVFALFMATETVTDTFFSWFPFYYEIKMAFVVWLLSPYTKGASLLYRKLVHPTLSSKEKEIDHFICQAKERGYESLVSFGKKSINVAATAAIQGQGALAGRLRSFSMQDLHSIPETAMVHYSDPLYLEEQELCRQPVGRRPAAQQPGSDSEEEEEEEDCWTDSEVSAPSRGRCKDPALPKPLARSQSFRQVKKRPPAKEVRRQAGPGGGEPPGLLWLGAGGDGVLASPSPNAAGRLLFAEFFSGAPKSFPEAETGPRALGSPGGAAGKASSWVRAPPALRRFPTPRAARPAGCGPRWSRCCRRRACPARLRAPSSAGATKRSFLGAAAPFSLPINAFSPPAQPRPVSCGGGGTPGGGGAAARATQRPPGGGMADEELRALLGGKGWPLPEAGGSDLGAPEPARLRGNVCYVVLAVLLNEKNEVLVMQEAKRECYGSWYLPAGRMEPRETVVEAVRREVQEETGLQCRPLTLLAVEERGPCWIRFVFLARPTGGTLKSLRQADAESLQALWWDRESPALPLRSRDILPLMDLALQYRASPRHPPVLPVELPCASVCQRFLLVFTGSNDSLWVLLETGGVPHLPVAISSLSPSKPGKRLLAAVQPLLQKCTARPEAAVHLQGLLGLQHLGKDPGQSDGICFNVVATVGSDGSQEPAPPALQEPAFTWWEVEEAALKNQLLQRLRTNSFLPIYS